MTVAAFFMVLFMLLLQLVFKSSLRAGQTNIAGRVIGSSPEVCAAVLRPSLPGADGSSPLYRQGLGPGETRNWIPSILWQYSPWEGHKAEMATEPIRS